MTEVEEIKPLECRAYKLFERIERIAKGVLFFAGSVAATVIAGFVTWVGIDLIRDTIDQIEPIDHPLIGIVFIISGVLVFDSAIICVITSVVKDYFKDMCETTQRSRIGQSLRFKR